MREGLTLGVTAFKPYVSEGLNPSQGIPEFQDQINDLTWLVGFDGQYYDCLEEKNQFMGIRWNPSLLRIGDIVSIFITRTNYFELIVNNICVFQSPLPLISYTRDGDIFDHFDLFPVMDMIGNAKKVKILPSHLKTVTIPVIAWDRPDEKAA